MPEKFKKCHLCAEEIPLLATECEFCGAKFTITSTGYCKQCHVIRDANEYGNCTVCGSVVTDWQIQSTPLEEVSPPIQKEIPSSSSLDSSISKSVLEVIPIKGEGVNYRFSAFFLDLIILISLISTLLAIFFIPMGERLTSLKSIDKDFLSSLFTGATLIVIPLTWFLYFFIFEGALGTTPGKALNHLRVIKKGGGKINWGQAAIRAFFSFLEDNLIGAIVIWSTPLKQRLGDLIAGTLVVNKEKVARAEFAPPGLSLVFHNYKQVDFAKLIKGTIERFGFYRYLILEGFSPNNAMIKTRIHGHFFRSEFDLLCHNIQERYQIHFPKKVIVWRLIMFILVIIPIIIGLIVFLIEVLPGKGIDDLSSSRGGGDNQAIAISTPLSPTSTTTLRPSATPRPTWTQTPLPLEVNFDNLGDLDDDTLVVMSGRLAMMSSTQCDYKCGLLLENPSNTTQKIIMFVTIGENPNQMKALPDNYSKGDIQIYLDDGSIAYVGYRLKVTGHKCTTTSGEPCIYTIRKIEFNKIP